MTLILGMFVGACIAGMGFLCGYGAGIATVPRESEDPDGPDGGETLQREESVARLTPTIPAVTRVAAPKYDDGLAPLSPETITVLTDIQRRRLVLLGPNATLAHTTEIM